MPEATPAGAVSDMTVRASTDDNGNLVRRAVDGDEQAWRQLVDRYGPTVWAVVRTSTDGRADAEDVYQATWLLLAENLHRLREPGAVVSWLVTTARHEAGRAMRTRRREAPAGLAGADLDQANRDDPHQALLRKMAHFRLGAAFARLDPGCQRLLRILAVTPDASYEQISEMLGVPHGTIGPKKSRCLTYLRRHLAAVDRQQSEEVA